MLAKTLGEGKRTGHELGNLSCSPPGQNPAVTEKQELMRTVDARRADFQAQEPRNRGRVFNLFPLSKGGFSGGIFR
jgi:hypothetical protein